MSILYVIPDSDPFLRKTSKRIRHVDDDLRALVSDMYETMVENWGIGLAAVQAGVPRRLFIYELPRRPVKGYEACATPRPSDNGETSHEAPSENEPDEEPEEADGGYTGNYTVCINPRILEREGSFIDEEGCLSRPGWLAKVERAIKVRFEACDIDMRRFERTVEGMEARCVQHEIDHLDGILFTDRALPGTLKEATEEEIREAEESEAIESVEDETMSAERVNDAAG
jgi:peptide deformylase